VNVATWAVSAVVDAATWACNAESCEFTPELVPLNALSCLVKLPFCIYKNPANAPTATMMTARTISVISAPREPCGFAAENVWA
jgi:hypothetical protein